MIILFIIDVSYCAHPRAFTNLTNLLYLGKRMQNMSKK